MSNMIIDLNGKWKCEGRGVNGEIIAVDGNVPGCVHTDLIKSDLIKDIYYRDNVKSIQWIEKCDFSYSRSFIIDEIFENAFQKYPECRVVVVVDLYGQSCRYDEIKSICQKHNAILDGLLKINESMIPEFAVNSHTIRKQNNINVL